MRVGETLFIEYKDPVTHEIQRYRSRIVEFTEEHLYIDLPVNEKTKKTGFFYIGTKFKAWIYTESAMFSFVTEFIARKKENIPMLIMTYPGNESMERSQRRKYVRVSTSVDVAVHSPNNAFTPFNTYSVDLSGGGAAIALPHNHHLKEGMLIDCWFVLPMHSGDFNYLKLSCDVIRFYRDKNSTKERASLNFRNINESDRVNIIRFCFEKEIETRKKLSK